MERFFTLIKLALRNLGRQKRRTFISVGAVGFGLAIALFFLTLGDGIYAKLMEDAVRTNGGNFSFEHPDYRDAPAIDLFVSDVDTKREQIANLPEVETTKLLVLGQGVIKTAHGATAVGIAGIEPDIEKQYSTVAEKITDGAYLEDADKNAIVIGHLLAKRLKVKIGKKVVLSTNNQHGMLAEELFRVKGIFKLGADEADGYLVQIPIKQARAIFDLDQNSATQLGILLKDADDLDKALKKSQAFTTNRATLRTWEETLPDLSNYIRTDRGSNQVFQGIMIIICLFTIFNTILMSALERTHEFSVQLALGTPLYMLKIQLVLEAFFLGFFGALFGFLVGGGLAWWVQVHGFDLRLIYEFEGELEVSGFVFDTIMRAKISKEVVLVLCGGVWLSTILMSLVPIQRLKNIPIAKVLR
ncbi:MAG: hypothetical protein CMH60_05415 [Myxococcales bacterium]|nr:hypothetical protein [Myxococcales bacterium]